MASKDRYLTRRILYDDDPKVAGKLRYDPDFHPEDIKLYFKERYDALTDPERFETEHRLDYVMAKVRPPSLAGYAAQVGVTRECLWSWTKKYEAFEEAVGVCKAMQEAAIIELTACGAYNPSFAALMMKNLHEWQDKVENTHRGGVTLNFDEQDEDA